MDNKELLDDCIDTLASVEKELALLKRVRDAVRECSPERNRFCYSFLVGLDEEIRTLTTRSVILLAKITS